MRASGRERHVTAPCFAADGKKSIIFVFYRIIEKVEETGREYNKGIC